MNFSRFFQPDKFIIALLVYFLGGGVARYLGAVISLPAFVLGLLTILFLLMGSMLLRTYFSNYQMTNVSIRDQNEKYRTRILQVSFTLFTLTGAFVITLLLSKEINIETGILLFLIALLLVLNEVPPIALHKTGYGELVLAIALAALIPAFSFFLQAHDEIHRLIPVIAFPLTLLAIAWQIAANFPEYARDIKSNHQSLLIRLTWQRALPIHNICILAAYLFFAISPSFGVPWGLIWPLFLGFPFSVIQILWLQRITNGGKPIWNIFRLFIPFTFGLIVYLLALTFWIR
jgi:1,4-dihydroxy-2-naphthoate octaprenyltransferase